MALTDVRPAPPRAESRDRPTRSFLSNPWLMLLAVAGLLLTYGWTFLFHPTLVAPTRDPAWYTWRANLLLHAPPDAIVKNWGPFGMFSGGYRVTTPVLGALLMRVAGVSRFTFSILFMVGVPILASLAIAAFAYRHRRDPLLFLLTLFAGGALFLTLPYVGYMDNITCLFILGMTLPFLQAARTSWGARTALMLLLFLAAMTHPTTLAIFVAVLVAGAALHLVTSRFSIKKVLDADGPTLISCAVGVVVGFAFWKVGAWGVKAPFADAALPPPYPASVFKSNTVEWVLALKPIVLGPLLAIAIGTIAATSLRRREPADEYHRMSLLWMLPYLGCFGFLFGLTYPYYRFMNTTIAIMVLAGMGAWIASRYFLRRFRAAGVLGVIAVMAGFGFILASGLPQWTSTAPTARWLDDSSRAALASVDAYVQAEPHEQPVLFIIDYQDTRKAWGWAKTFSNAARAGLTGDAALRSIIYFGNVDDYLAFHPSHGIDPVFNKVSRGFFRDTEQRVSRYPLPPSVFVVGRFNQGTSNGQALDDAKVRSFGFAPVLQMIGSDVAVVSTPGNPHVATFDPRAARVAQLAGAREAAGLADPPGLLANPGHLLRVLVAILFMLIVPGLLAARWFELEDGLLRLALVPGLSVALLMASAVFVVAVHRKPFGLAEGLAAVALATVAGGAFELLARRRASGKQVVMPFLRRSVSLFENRRFAALMGAVFLAVLGDGIVQGALAKTIAFGGHKGFDLTNAHSARDILGLVLLTYLPYTFISPFMGVVIDRFDRRTLLIFGNGVRAGVVLMVGLVGVSHLPDAALIGLLLLTLASTRLVLAIKSAGMPILLEGRNLMQGNSISQAGSAVLQLLGAGIAFAGTAAANASVVIIAGGIVYGVGSFVGLRTGNLESERRDVRFWEEAKRVLHDVGEGIGEVRRRAGARLGLIGFVTIRALASYVALVFALEVRQILGTHASKKGIIIAGLAAAAGAALGFLIAERLRDRIRPDRLLVIAMVVAGAGVVLFGGIVSTVGLAAVGFVASLGYFLGKISADTIMQQALADRYRGRGFSFFDVAYNLAWIVPALVLWALWTHVSPRLLQVGAGIVFLAAAGLIGMWTRRMPAPEEPASVMRGD